MRLAIYGPTRIEIVPSRQPVVAAVYALEGAESSLGPSEQAVVR